MKKLCLAMTAVALITMPSCLQARDLQNSITAPEFRQALLDLATFLDARKGTNLVSQIQAMPEDAFEKLLPNVPNARAFQAAAEKLKSSLGSSTPGLALAGSGSSAHLSPADVPQNVPQYPNCPANTIIDDSQTAVCTPEYPNPNDSAWQNLVNPVIYFGALSGSYTSLVNQVCDRDIEASISLAVSALAGTVYAAADGCDALPSPGANVCFGVVTPIAVAGAVSQGLMNDCAEQDSDVNSAKLDASFHNTVTIYNSLENLGGVVSTALSDLTTTETNTATLLTDFTTLNASLTTVGNNLTTQVNSVDVDVLNVKNTLASTGTNLQNQINGVDTDVSTVGKGLATQLTGVDTDIANRATQIDNEIAAEQALALRLQIEANLASSGNSTVGLFEVPQSAGGYLELVRSIVADVFSKMQASDQSIPPGLTFAQVDISIANQQYITAYQELKQLYQLIVQ